MSYRTLAVGVMVATIIVLSTFAVVAQQAPASPGTAIAGALRTPWGDPDLQGIWSAGTLTPMQRPVRWANRPVLTAEEAAAYAVSNPFRGAGIDPTGPPRPGDVGAYNEIFSEWGGDTAQLLDRGRTSLIVDPPNGRIPPFSPEGVKRENLYRDWLRMLSTGDDPRVNDRPPNGVYNSVRMGISSNDPESRGPYERCFSEPLPYSTDPATFVRIVQSPSVVVLFLDRHQGRGYVRTVNIGGKHLPSHIRLLHGDSVGRWEGDTLVVDTTNFTFKWDYRGSRENLHLVERFTRASDGQLIHRVTLEDPTTWTRPWTYEVGWTRRPDKTDQIYEQSCHEGNFGIIGLLAGRRHQERLYAEGKGPNADLQNREGTMWVLPAIAADGTVPE